MSHKVLIVDDEQVEREGLKAILHKGLPSLTIELARNGDDALEKSAVFLPDLVMMDIKMPGLSGLETIRRMRKICPDAKYIMVTAYDTFEYARTALQLGVKDYLLKPSRTAEIIDIVRRVLEEINAERRERMAKNEAEKTLQRMLPVVETDVVTQLLYDHVHEVHLAELVPLLGGEAAREAFVMLISLGGAENAAPFRTALRAKIREMSGVWVGALSGRQLPLIVFRERGRSYRAQAASMIRRLLSMRNRFPQAEIFIGVGMPYPSLGELRFSYQEALIAAADTTLPAGHRFYEDTAAFGDFGLDHAGKAAEREFIDHIRNARWPEVRKVVSDCLDACEKGGAAPVYAGQRALELLWIIARVLDESGIETEKPTLSFKMQNYRQLRAEVGNETDKLIRAAQSRYRNVESDAVHRMKRYILDHAHEALSLEDIAAMVNLSPFYFSKLFKEATGQNFIDFLTDCRIAKARQLLLDPERSLKQIAFEAGYNDPNYFSKVFKKVTGQSPSAYRKMRLGR